MNLGKTAKEIRKCFKKYAEEWHVKVVGDEIHISFMTEVRMKIKWDGDSKGYYMKVYEEIYAGMIETIANICQKSENEYLSQKG